MPKNTRAVLVGIEEYTGGDEWRLDGPTVDVCRVAAWLLGRGVPPEKITLFASPIAKNQMELPSDTLDVRPADRASIHDSLTQELSECTEDFLFIYWAGHGIIDELGDRRLFYADASMADGRNLDLNSFLLYARSASFRCPTQIVIVDACQTFLEDLDFVNQLPTETFPVGRPGSGVDQRVFLAASPGEVAENVDRANAGLFSQVVLRELRGRSPQEWPPNLGEVAVAVELFGAFDDGTPFLPMPSRVIVSCCSSSGNSLLAGEGLGIAAGLIQAGAAQVISTAVDIMDTSFTEAFEDLLIKGMLAADADHADLLRAAQLRMLREWKIYSLRGGIDNREDIKDPHPIIWTAYHAY